MHTCNALNQLFPFFETRMCCQLSCLHPHLFLFSFWLLFISHAHLTESVTLGVRMQSLRPLYKKLGALLGAGERKRIIPSTRRKTSTSCYMLRERANNHLNPYPTTANFTIHT
ncbi:hypothetical protein BJ741DRAFT_632684 [Chytriomyces cf. hyalinus JEL632]|nr:hypothetical protein BJ741DRAFT_632684 [Chytriomyces cf. hyalinus JEL632]